MSQEKPVIHAYSDMFVKYLFGSPGNEDLLLSFINAVMIDSEFPRLAEVTVINPFNLKEFGMDKESILDVKAEDSLKRQYDIEVQVSGGEDFKNRSLYYWAKLYTSQIQEGNAYSELSPCIAINVLNFIMFPEKPFPHTCFQLREKDNPDLVLTDRETLHFLELKKLKSILPVDKLQKWLYFLRCEGAMDEILKQIIEEDPDIAKAHRKFREFTEDEKLRDLALRREMWRMDQISLRAAAQKEGLKQGIEKGIEQGIEIGKDQGKLSEKQEILIRILKNKYNTGDDVVNRINGVKDLACLDAALDAAIAGEPLAGILGKLEK